MNDMEEIAGLIDLSCDGTYIKYTTDDNPFSLINNEESYEKKVKSNREAIMSEFKCKNLSLVQRTELERPYLTPLVSRGTLSRCSVRSTQTPSEMMIPHGRKMTMNQFVYQKRLIYKCELIIQRQKKEIARLQNEEIVQEKKLAKECQEIDEQNALAKSNAYQIENQMAMARKAARLEAARAYELKRKREASKTNIEYLKASISRYEELIETYTPYKKFLESYLEPGETIQQIFTHPEILIDKIHLLEDQNLHLIQHYDIYEQMLDAAVEIKENQMVEKIKITEEMRDKVGKIKTIPIIDFQLSPEQKETKKQQDNELNNLRKLVTQTYVNCFKADIKSKSIDKLHNIEVKLEEIYSKLVHIHPDFIEYKQTQINKERREKLRKERNEQKEKEQQIKKDQAIQRAKKPIWQKQARPHYRRVLPTKHKVKIDPNQKEKDILAAQEQELLFGDDY